LLSGALLKRKFEAAVASGVDVIIFDIHSPGGATLVTFELMDMVREAKNVETVAYIGTDAISGAALLSLSMDTILMKPDARIGDAGEIVMGEDGRSARVAVSQGNLTLRVREAPVAVQPNPFANGETVVVPRSRARIDEEPGIALAEIPPGASLSELVAGLNALGVSPRDMIDILKSIKAAGALHAEFVVR
jgi:flagellar P-ring protein precursor FlgI